MAGYVIIKLKTNYFAFNVEDVIRVINIPKITPLPNSKNYIDGLITFEENSFEVVNFRQFLDYTTLKEEFRENLNHLLHSPLENKEKLLQLFDEILGKTIKDKALYENILELKEHFVSEGTLLEKNIQMLLKNISYIVNKDQKIVIYSHKDQQLAIKVDEIEKIVTIDKNDITLFDNEDIKSDQSITFRGIYEEDGKLIYLIDTITIEN